MLGKLKKKKVTFFTQQGLSCEKCSCRKGMCFHETIQQQMGLSDKMKGDMSSQKSCINVDSNILVKIAVTMDYSLCTQRNRVLFIILFFFPFLRWVCLVRWSEFFSSGTTCFQLPLSNV